ncbi:MAG TPA: hypothetical protein VGF50_06785, partial [Caulobacteraceae bacterium]
MGALATNRWAARGAAGLAGLAAAFANQPWGFLPGLLGYAALLWLVDHAPPPSASPTSPPEGDENRVSPPAGGSGPTGHRGHAWRAIRSAFFRSWLCGLAYYVVSTWWIDEAFQVDAREQGWMGPFAVVFVAAYMALYWGLAAALFRLTAPRNASRVLVFAGWLALGVWLSGHLFT